MKMLFGKFAKFNKEKIENEIKFFVIEINSVEISSESRLLNHLRASHVGGFLPRNGAIASSSAVISETILSSNKSCRTRKRANRNLMSRNDFAFQVKLIIVSRAFFVLWFLFSFLFPPRLPAPYQ